MLERERDRYRDLRMEVEDEEEEEIKKKARGGAKRESEEGVNDPFLLVDADCRLEIEEEKGVNSI